MRLLFVVAVVAFLSGWWVSGLYQDSQQRLIEQAAAKAAAKIDMSITASARLVENKLQELKANERHTEKIIRTEMVKPVFSNVCASDDFVRLFNESSERAEATLAGKSADRMPD
ncbi:hypothetical protein [Limnobaculum xujianqingii]|uniref:hypothetical protein n=1 Tax=Limnobaculum xujianqingii TaxID=2738837 RepID=UPI00112E670C|nr:hypothetical protein [Limnobaculum xujianqingii]